MKNNLQKDFIREIRKNKGRFLSILFIVMLGTAFFSGIRSTGSDMKYSADDMYRRSQMMDIRVLGTLGLTDRDLADIQAIDSVKRAVGGHTKEVVVNEEDEQLVLKLIARTEGVNEVILQEGRMPENETECIADIALSDYKTGDVIRVESGTEDDLSEDLKETEFTIVGKGILPYYMDLTRGVGTIGNGTITGFLVIPDSAFDMDVFTEIYVQVEGADSYNSYSDEYETIVEGTVDEIEAMEETITVRRYNEVVSDAEEEIEDAKKEIDDGQKELDDARKELDDAKTELDDAKKELDDGQKELDDARQELDDGKKELDDAGKKVDDGEAELADAKNTLDEGESQLAEARAELDQAKAKLENGEQQLTDAKDQLDKSKEKIESGEKELAAAKKTLDEKKPELDTAKEQLDAAKQELDAAEVQIEDGKKQLEEGKKALEEAYAELSEKQKELEAAHAETDAGEQALKEGWAAYETGAEQLEAQIEQLETAKAGYADMEIQLDTLKKALEEDPENPELIAQIEVLTATMETVKAQIETGETAIAEAQAVLDATYKELSEKQAALDAAKEQLAEADKLLQAGFEEYEAGKAEYETNQAAYEEAVSKYESGKADYESGLNQYKEGKKQYDNGVAAYEAGLEELKEGKKQYEEGVEAYKKALEEYTQGKQQYEEGLAEYENGLNEWLEGKQQYEDGVEEWEDGKRRYEEALAEYEDGLKEYEDGLKEYEDGLKEYEDGLKEYEDGEKEYKEAYDEHMPEIEDGRKEVEEAEEEVRKLRVPDLYVLDREMIQSAASFGQDAKRMDSLGQVFPVIFFLVAALVSLTAMTRMVDEQRQQIGTLKALGFSEFAITWKYLQYALIPSLAGGIIGVALGEYIIPEVIIDAYRMMYTGLDKILLPFNAKQGILAVVIACACTSLAAIAACHKKLRDKPAELMRPEAPKSGRRVFLEYVKPIWKRMNFTGKSTVRNLFRYKKRLLMTIIGIGSCMGLMMVGFGIYDSITVVAKRQYKEIFMQEAYVSVDVDATASERRKLQETIDNDPEFTANMELSEISATLYNGKIERSAVLYIPEDSVKVGEFLRFQDRRTREPYAFPTKGVGLAEKTATMLGVEVGDTILVQKGESGEKAEAMVSVIVENYVQHYCFMTPDTYQELFGEEPEFNEILLRYDDTSEDNQKRIGSLLVAEPGSTSVSFTTDFQKTIDDMLDTLTLVIWVLIIAAGLLAFVVLYNLNNINIMERKRELATLKVLGFQDMEVAMYVYRENVWLTLLGIVLGCFVGMILHRFTILTVEVDLMMFGRSVRAASYVISALLTLLFALIVNTAMYFSLKKIDMIESLKSVE